MTSLSPFDALRALLPGLGRDAGPGMPLAGPDADGDVPEAEGDRRGPHGHWRASEPPHGPPHAHLRGDGTSPATPHGDPGPLADAWRQTPPQALLRELQQLPPETLRQLVQLASQQPGHEALAGQAGPLARALAHVAAEARNAAQQHPASADARAAAQTLVQQAVQARAAEPGREAVPPSFAGRADDVRSAMAASGSLAASDPSQRPVLSTLAALLARGDGLPAHAHGTTSPPAGPGAPPPHGQEQELAAQQQLQARLAGDATSTGRADGWAAGAADPASSGGLLGLAGAAGVTLAAVGNPAGTTHAVAPQAPSRLRQAETARNDERKRVSEDEMQDEGEGGDRDRDSRDGTGRERGRAAKDDRAGDMAAAGRDFRAAAGRASANGAGAHPGEAGANEASGSHPAVGAGESASRAPEDTAIATAAGHTAAIGLLLPRYGSGDDTDEDAQLQGHAGDGPLAEEDAEIRRARSLRWGYWALIAVAYGCFGLALATLAPAWFDLPIAQENRPPWRHGLTAVGLVSALWAWVLSRRIR